MTGTKVGTFVQLAGEAATLAAPFTSAQEGPPLLCEMHNIAASVAVAGSFADLGARGQDVGGNERQNTGF
jgi:hypothetical protein